MKYKFVVIIFITFLNGTLPAQTFPLSAEAFGDQLVVGMVGQAPSSINPYQIDDITEGQISRIIFGTGLIQQPDRFGQIPSLVDRYIYPGSRESQGLVWKYVIKRNINFHNGIPLRNSDVKFTFRVLKKWGGYILNRKLDFSDIDLVETSGDLEIQFRLKQKDMHFDQRLSDIPILSRVYYEDVLRDGFELFSELAPIGYGAFQFEENTGKNVILNFHPHYVFGRPFLNRVVFRFFEDEQHMVDNFIQGNVDFIEIQDRITAQRLHQILRNEIKIFPTPRPEKKLYYLLFNVKRFPLRMQNVREAIRGAINPTNIVKRLIEQNGHLAYSLVDYTNRFFYKELFRDRYQPEMSLRMLNENGWQVNRSKGNLEKNGRDLSFELIFEKNSYLEESIARAIKIYLAEVGINVEPKPVPLIQKKELIKQNNFTAVLDSYSYFEQDLYNGIKTFYFSVLKNRDHYPNYENRILENLFKKADNFPQEREQLIQRFQIALHQDVPAVFLFFDDKIIYAVKNRFQNMRVSFSSGQSYYHRLKPFENWFVPKSLQKYRSR